MTYAPTAARPRRSIDECPDDPFVVNAHRRSPAMVSLLGHPELFRKSTTFLPLISPQ